MNVKFDFPLYLVTTCKNYHYPYVCSEIKCISLCVATRCQDIPAPPRSSGLIYKPDPQNPLPNSGSELVLLTI